jgi:tetratricopeptide (TPR) repeat protein
MVVSEAERLKDEGNARFKESDFSGAVEKYSAAIDLDGSNHVYFSNRAAANLKRGSLQDALKDGIKCVELAPNWPKGHMRMRDAYTQLGEDEKAQAADANYKRLSAASTSSSSAAAASASARQTSGGGGTAASSGVSLSSVGTIDKVLLALQFFFVTNVVLFIIPGLGSSSAFQRAMLAAVGVYIVGIYKDYQSYFTGGRSTQEIAQVTLKDWRMHYFMSAIFFAFLGSGRILYLLPHFLGIIGFVAEAVLRFRPNVAAQIDQVLGISSALLPRFVHMPPQQWASLSKTQKWANFNQAQVKYSTGFEVAIAFSLILELLTPNRNFLTLFAYWNFMRIRTMVSPEVGQAFKAVDSRILSLVGRVPAVMNVYMKIRAYAQSQVQMPSPEEARAAQERGFMGNLRQSVSQCSIQ